MNANATRAAHVTAALDSKARKAKADFERSLAKSADRKRTVVFAAFAASAFNVF